MSGLNKTTTGILLNIYFFLLNLNIFLTYFLSVKQTIHFNNSVNKLKRTMPWNQFQ